jgi:hypothetical protein
MHIFQVWFFKLAGPQGCGFPQRESAVYVVAEGYEDALRAFRGPYPREAVTLIKQMNGTNPDSPPVLVA